ncbi:PH domain-containing protein [Nocardia arizonensis]|uniref:PH domain-containing protein n=1 Tax=Nocardia arizonensis TaxID=1141647 RepID=UPI000A9AA9B0|nr:PH domain-containing protein [Nocardia arizonensis]
MSSPHQSVPPAKSSHTPPEGSDTGSSTAAERPAPAAKVIRVPRLALLGVLVLLLGVFFFFVGAPAFLWGLPVLPLGVAVWVLRTQTTVSANGLDLRTVFGSRHVDWERVKGLRIPKRGFVRVHLDDDSELTLPAVSYDRLRDLITASHGRIPDPFAAAEQAEDRARRAAEETDEEQRRD